MLAFSFYLLKVIICSGVLFGYYWFLLRNKIFHGYNRFYLLAIVVLSLALPLMKINIWQKASEPPTNVIKILQVVNSSDEYMDEVIIYSQLNHINKEQILSFLFIAICAVFCFVLLRGLYRIRILLKTNPATFIENICFIKTNAKGTPFSFLRFIFWNDAIDIETKAGRQIFKHEVAHIQEKHSYDKLFINIVLIIFWCNPFFWLIRKELNMIHEFVADQKAIEDGDTADFAAMILQATYPQHSFQLANNFFYSPIKRRLLMLTRQNTKASYISRLLVLPVALFVFAAFTLKTKTYIENRSNATNKTFTVMIDAGHGGADKGATSGEMFEKDITLTLAQRIKALNQSDNINIILTRETDIYQSPQQKAALAKEAGADLFISIHVDGAPATAKHMRTGMFVYVARDQYANSEASKVLASAVIANFQKNYGLNVASNPQQIEHGIWVLQSNTCPSILIEAGCINNTADLAYLRTDKAVETFANNILKSIGSYAAISAKLTAVKIDSLKNTIIENVEHNAIKDTAAKSNELKILAPRIKEDMYISAEKIVVDDKNDATFYGNIKLKLSDINKSQMPIILNGTKPTDEELEHVDWKHVDYVRLLSPQTAMATYGDMGKNGIMLINTKMGSYGNSKTIYNEAVKLRVGNLTGNNLDVEAFKRQKKLALTEGYKFESATVYFSGKGFTNVSTAQLFSDDLFYIEHLIKKCVGGTVVTFDNVKVKDEKGNQLYLESSAYILSDNSKEEQDSDKLFTKVENEPEFPGGKDGWRDYLIKNLNAGMPVDEGWKAGVYKIVVQFIVDTEGNVSDVKTDDHPGSKTASQCINLIKNGPKWIPAVQNGKKVKAYRKQPITFVVSEQ